ncbi:MAG: hypothetical protein U5K55_11280 [Aliarcobacter sp.]|nr:hypothetical protein [Aliarcobacter sp.]
MITKTFKESYFPKVFGKYEYKFIDKKTNIVLATAFKISFLVATINLEISIYIGQKKKKRILISLLFRILIKFIKIYL